MEQNKLAIALAIVSIILFLFSRIVNVSFVERYIDEDHRIGEHAKIRVTIFQTQLANISFLILLLCVVLLLFKDKVNRLNKGLITNLSLLAVVFILIFFVGEVVCRLFFMKQIDAEFNFGPMEKKFMGLITYNELGFRDINHSFKGDSIRIVVLGDSFTFGRGIKNLADIYPRILQQKLDEKFGKNRYEVVTFAKDGYSTLDELNIFKRYGLKFKPKILVIGYYLNDVEGPNSRIGFEDIFFHHYFYPYELGNILYRNSYFYYFLETRIKNLFTMMGLRKSVNDYFRHLYSASNPFFNQHKYVFKELIGIAKSHNISVVVMVIPALYQLKPYPYYYAHDYIKNLSLENDVAYLDLLHSFLNVSTDLRVSAMDAHMNEIAHNITANQLFNFLIQNKLVS